METSKNLQSEKDRFLAWHAAETESHGLEDLKCFPADDVGCFSEEQLYRELNNIVGQPEIPLTDDESF